MRNLICAAVFAVITCVSGQCAAADIDFHFAKVDDDFISEIWYNNQLFWRVAFVPSGAIPASTGSATYQTVIAPSFQDGFFLFNVK